MKRANRLMLLIGVALAVISFVAVLALGGLNQQPREPAQVPDVTVVVAATDLPLGTPVTADKLSTTTKPGDQATDTYSSPDDVVGKVVRRPVTQGTALTRDDFETTVSVPELIKALGPGLRAMAVPLSTVDAVGALLQPGDSVDVLMSMKDTDLLDPMVIPNAIASPGLSGEAPAPYVTLDDYLNNTTVKVVVQNVQVLASITASPVTATNVIAGQATPQPDVVVLLAVTPQQAEVVRFAQLDGNVSLVLRSTADATAAEVDTTGITLRQLVDEYGVLPPAPITAVTP